MVSKPNLSVTIGRLVLRNPVMPASGTFGPEMAAFIDFNKLGAIIPKSITKSPRPGNKIPRVCEVEGGMINSIGIQSQGVEAYIRHTLPAYAGYETPLIASISGESVDEFAELAERLSKDSRIAALELNISCPNLRDNGRAFGMDEKSTFQLIRQVRVVTDKPLIAKLTPNVTCIQDIAVAAEQAGVDALTVANTFLAMSIDIETRKPKIGNIMGGISGPAIKPLVIRLIFQVHQATELPIIGSGGVMNGRDAIEMILAGATAVQIGTANFISPTVMPETIDEIRRYMVSHNIETIAELIGKLELE